MNVYLCRCLSSFEKQQRVSHLNSNFEILPWRQQNAWGDLMPTIATQSLQYLQAVRETNMRYAQQAQTQQPDLNQDFDHPEILRRRTEYKQHQGCLFVCLSACLSVRMHVIVRAVRLHPCSAPHLHFHPRHPWILKDAHKSCWPFGPNNYRKGQY